VGLRSGSDAADATSASKLCVSYLGHVQLDVEYQAPAIADLQVVRLEVHKKSGATGCSSDGTNTLTVVVKNAGTAAPEKPADLAISYSFVSDRVQTITREQAGVLTAGPGGEQRIDFTDLPMGGGDTQVQVTIDKQNAVTLAKHNDPSFSGNISCDTRAADLSIKSAKFNRVDVTGPNVKTACIAGSDNTLEVIVSNLGDKEPGVFYTGILVDGQLVAKASVGSVSPLSEKTSFIGEVNSKITIPEGTHTVQAIVDPEDKIAEANEDNNTLPAVTVTCAAKKP
jgi:subtilase family serine protease